MPHPSHHNPPPPRIIGHRGAPGLLPEHTLQSYSLAIESGADAIELDLVATLDRQLIARHDLELSLSTNVATLPEFARRRTSHVIDGVNHHGWFAQDFSLDDIRRLRARERFPFRPQLRNDTFAIPSLDDVLDLIDACRTASRNVGVYLELKSPAYHEQLGLDLSQILISLLRRRQLQSAPWLAVESFEPTILRRLHGRLEIPLVQLLAPAPYQPPDLALAGGKKTYADLLSPPGLRDIARYARGISVWKHSILPTALPPSEEMDFSTVPLQQPTTLIADARAAGLEVEVWTFRDEPRFLPADFNADPVAEYRRFFDLGVDAVISDFPATAVAARDACADSASRNVR